MPRGGERDGMGGGKVAYFDDVTLKLVPESSAQLAGLLAGELDYIAAPNLTDYDQRRTGHKPALYEAAILWTIIFNPQTR